MNGQVAFDLEPPEPTRHRKHVFGDDDHPADTSEGTTVESYVHDAGAWARDAGMDASVEADHHGFQEAVRLIAAYPSGSVLFASRVRRQQKLGSPRVLGAAFRTAAKRGLIEPDGFSTSLAASRHSGYERRWRRT
jgi:hypothetical protein